MAGLSYILCVFHKKDVEIKIKKYTLQFYVGCFFVFSVPAFLFPDWFSTQLGYDLDGKGALMEFVGVYGGLILGVGIYLIFCNRHEIKMLLGGIMPFESAVSGPT